MAEHDNILGVDDRTRLIGDVTFLMLKGAGYALVGCLAVLFTILIIAAIGRALPPESRDTPDPINRSSLDMSVPEIRQIA